MLDIYTVYVPVDVEAQKAEVFAQVMREFIAACQAVYAASPDDVEKPCPAYANPHLYDVVRKYPKEFEEMTKLKLDGEVMMTVRTHAKKLKDAPPVKPNDEPIKDDEKPKDDTKVKK